MRELEDFLPIDLSRNTQTEIVKTNIPWLSAKVAHNQFDQMHWRKLSAMVIPNCWYHFRSPTSFKCRLKTVLFNRGFTDICKWLCNALPVF